MLHREMHKIYPVRTVTVISMVQLNMMTVEFVLVVTLDTQLILIKIVTVTVSVLRIQMTVEFVLVVTLDT
jgi:flavin reductase (DIM6/NTAB) family NADH-FMN oxidoreductase RutF